MSASLSKISDLSPAPITAAQRRCLSHLLRNMLEGLGATLNLIENAESNFTPRDLLCCISSPLRLLERMDHALKEGSYCVLTEEECKWIGKYCGCAAESCDPREVKNTESIAQISAASEKPKKAKSSLL